MAGQMKTGSYSLPASFLPGLAVEDAAARFWMIQAILRLRREVAWLWHLRGADDKAPAVIDPLSESLDFSRHERARISFLREDETATFLSAEIAKPFDSGSKMQRGGLGWLMQELGLSKLDGLTLGLALLHASDSSASAVMAAVLNRTQVEGPSLALLQRLIDKPEDVLGLFDAGHPLVMHRILTLHGQDWSTPFTLPPMITRQLMFPDAAPPRALRILAVEADALPPVPQRDLAIARIKSRPAGQMCIVPVSGARQAPRVEVCTTIAKACGLGLAEISLPISAENIGTLATLSVAAWLRGAALYLPTGTAGIKDAVAGLVELASLPVVLFIGVEDGEPIGHLPQGLTQPRLSILPLEDQRREALWRAAVPSVTDEEPAKLARDLARRFRFEAAGIARVGRATNALGRSLTKAEIHAACRADLDLGDLAQPVAPRFELKELMLPQDRNRQVEDIVQAMRVLATVHQEWGTGTAWNEGGLSVLFAGPPGTGKTMAAEAIATELGMPMYRIDLSQIVNKYIGETEKNLRRLFDAADSADIILFFDEADALFGKRTEVKDAHDRYANLEVSYLLERMERFRGMAILASNRRKDLDEAFLRRLRHVVNFPIPEAPERRRIWEAVMPEGVECEGLDITFLADRIPLAGGYIRSAVFNACLASVRPGEPPRLSMAALVRSIKDEFDKLGRAVSLEQFGPYAKLLEGRR